MLAINKCLAWIRSLKGSNYCLSISVQTVRSAKSLEKKWFECSGGRLFIAKMVLWWVYVRVRERVSETIWAANAQYILLLYASNQVIRIIAMLPTNVLSVLFVFVVVCMKSVARRISVGAEHTLQRETVYVYFVVVCLPISVAIFHWNFGRWCACFFLLLCT